MRQQLISLLKTHTSKQSGIFIPIPLEDYVDKIISLSTIVPYFIEGELKAFISYYKNNPEKTVAFLTMILVAKDYQGKGIGKLLLEFSIKDILKSGFKKYSLEVSKDNASAIQFYLNYGFTKKEERDAILLMVKEIQ